MSRLPIGVIGLGNAFVPHGKALAELADRIDVRWAVSRSAARTGAVATQCVVEDIMRHGAHHRGE